MFGPFHITILAGLNAPSHPTVSRCALDDCDFLQHALHARNAVVATLPLVDHVFILDGRMGDYCVSEQRLLHPRQTRINHRVTNRLVNIVDDILLLDVPIGMDSAVDVLDGVIANGWAAERDVVLD